MEKIYSPKGYQVLIKPVPFQTLVDVAKEIYAETQKQT